VLLFMSDVYHTVFPALWSCLAVGLAGVIRVSRRLSAPERRDLWIKYISYAVIVHVTVLVMIWDTFAWPVVATALVLAGHFEIIRASRVGSERNGRALLLSLPIYTAIAGGFVAFVCLVDIRHQLFVYVTVCLFDGFSQIVGQLVGRHKLAPKISPAKTVEGLAGGLFAGVIGSLFLHQVIGLPWHLAFLQAFGICIAALVGDLIASLYKRLQGVKDFGTVIPRHGGILDRFDSLISAGALFLVAQAAIRNVPGGSNLLFLVLVYLLVLLLGEIVYRRGLASAEKTRKFAHLGTAVVSLAMPALGIDIRHLLVLSILFTGIMVITAKRGWLKSIHAINRSGSLGSYCFPSAFFFCYLAYTFHGVRMWFYVPVLVLAVSDTLAALVGMRWPVGRFTIMKQEKTLMGSGAFFISTLVITLSAAWFDSSRLMSTGTIVVGALLIAFTTTVLEALTVRGLDNLVVPFSALGLLCVLM
jgi:phosphatidate cytidylyltransferase